MAWLSGVIFSRGMSQVSEMIPATVSKVDGMRSGPLWQRAGTNIATANAARGVAASWQTGST